MQRLLNYPQTPTLPIEIIESEILHRIPPKSLLRFKCVSKSFQTIISTAEFIVLHLNHSLSSDANRNVVLIGSCSELGTIDLDAPKSLPITPTMPIFPFDDEKSFIFGHCHGLFCMGTFSHGFYYYKLINPSTGGACEIPSSDYVYFDANYLNLNFGFGFDDVKGEYKVVRIVEDVNGYDFDTGYDVKYREIFVCSSSEDSWRLVEKVVSPQDSMLDIQFGALINDHLLHWPFWCSLARVYRIGCFDVRDERWVDDVSLPESEFGLEVDFEEDVADFFMQSQPYVVDLGVVDGCLCLLTTYMIKHKSVWIMKEYGMKESWVKVLDKSDSYVTRSLRFVPVAYTSRGARNEIVLWNDCKCRLTWYDITHKTSTGIKLRGLGKCYWEHCFFYFDGAYVCKGSLVAPRWKEGRWLMEL